MFICVGVKAAAVTAVGYDSTKLVNDCESSLLADAVKPHDI